MSSYLLKGFSLLEMAVVLAVLGVLLAGGIASLPENRVVVKQLESQTTQANIKEQLMKFALINKYLPCPDTDTPLDGRENRTPINVGGTTIEFCSRDTGAVPYLDIGLRIEDAQDAYGNSIRYAVNRDADDQVNAVICDPLSSASYFCNAGANRAIFTLVNTPPRQGEPGAGNYRVCNANVNACNNGTAAADLQSDGVSVVLVAYNEDGAQTLNNCNAAGGANTENCDQDAFYHQQVITTQEDNFFDDTIVTISGYEIKSKILSPVTVWTNSALAPALALASTYEGYNLEADGNDAYTPMDDENTPDVIRVNRNITTALNLGAGDDQVVVGNDLSSELEYNNNTGVVTDIGTQAALDTGDGDDTVYIVGAANSSVTLGEGNDTFVLGKNLTESLTADAGDDKVWIQGNVESSATFTLGEGNDVVWLGKNEISEYDGSFHYKWRWLRSECEWWRWLRYFNIRKYEQNRMECKLDFSESC